MDLTTPALWGAYAAATASSPSPVPAVVAPVLAFLLALLGRHLLGRAALRWWLALRDTRPEQRAEIIRALTEQAPSPAPVRPAAHTSRRRTQRQSSSGGRR